jgi:glycosyltransferase involved in cell wall biosynthesis
MKSKGLISVLIANYNNGQYLKEAVDSVLIQTYKNWEIIILDDCSNNNSKEVYGLYDQNSRIKVYFN